jgi:hypothetical protein
MRSLSEEVHGNMKALSVLKKRGRNVGRLKFLSRCNRVELKQSGSLPDYREQAVCAEFKKPFKKDKKENYRL